jgi:hypothetical protein
VFVSRGRTLAHYRSVEALLAQRLSHHEIARRTGIPRSTVRHWHRLGRAPRGLWEASYERWRPPVPDAYCYLLGLYLGDGCVVRPPRGACRLDLALDQSYPEIVEAAASAVAATVPDGRLRRSPGPGAIHVIASHPLWPSAIPQAGPGPKHERRIELVDWQLELTQRHPRQLLRGLIHSDGSRVVNRFKTKLPSGRLAEYRYVRYFFTNYSADIRRIFCDHCDVLGIRWTQSSFKNISVARRHSVSLLDSFVGPKR